MLHANIDSTTSTEIRAETFDADGPGRFKRDGCEAFPRIWLGSCSTPRRLLRVARPAKIARISDI